MNVYLIHCKNLPGRHVLPFLNNDEIIAKSPNEALKEILPFYNHWTIMPVNDLKSVAFSNKFAVVVSATLIDIIGDNNESII